MYCTTILVLVYVSRKVITSEGYALVYCRALGSSCLAHPERRGELLAHGINDPFPTGFPF